MPKMQLDIVTAERLLVSEQVDYVSAPGIDGVLGILPRHAPLLTALAQGSLRYKKDGEEHEFAIGGGFMEVRPDHVTVLADSAEHAEEIDERRRGMMLPNPVALPDAPRPPEERGLPARQSEIEKPPDNLSHEGRLS